MGRFTDELALYTEEKRLFRELEGSLRAKLMPTIETEIVPRVQRECDIRSLGINMSEYRVDLDLEELSVSFQTFSEKSRFYSRVNEDLALVYGQIQEEYGLRVSGFVQVIEM